MTLTKRIAELERLLAEATPGEWPTGYGFEQSQPGAYIYRRGGVGVVLFAEDVEPEPADAELAVAAVNLLPELIAERRKLRARVLDDMAERAGYGCVVPVELAERWDGARHGSADIRAACLLRSWATAIRAGRLP